MIFTIEEIQQRLQCGKNKATAILKNLEDHKLIKRSRPKKDGPYHIVVRPFAVGASKSNLPKSQNQDCPVPEINPQQVSKQGLNNTDINKTDINKTEEITLWERKIKTQIEYDILLSEFPKNQLDAIVDVMLQAMTSTGRTIPVGGIPTDTPLVKAILQKVTAMKVQYVFHHMDEQDRPIQSYRAYFLARLCDPEWVVDAFYETLHKQLFM